jgi:hypothetical protein
MHMSSLYIMLCMIPIDISFKFIHSFRYLCIYFGFTALLLFKSMCICFETLLEHKKFIPTIPSHASKLVLHQLSRGD